MELKYILALAGALLSFFTCFFGLLILQRTALPDKWQNIRESLYFLPIYVACTLIFIPAYFINSQIDFIYGINLLTVLVPLLATLAIWSFSIFEKLKKYTWAAILLMATICAFFLPSELRVLPAEVPFWLDRCVLIALWFLLSNFYYLLNGLDGILGLQNLSIGIGLCILYLLGASPQFYGMVALGFSTSAIAYLIFNWYPSKVNLSKGAAQTWGFLAGWILMSSSAEGTGPCAIILIAYFVIELFNATIKKLLLRDKYSELVSNTTYFQANISGLSPHKIGAFLVKLQCVFLILSGFQIYAPNSFSLPILSFIIGAWFLTKLQNWQTPNKTLRQLNHDFVEDIKQDIDNFKNDLGKD